MATLHCTVPQVFINNDVTLTNCCITQKLINVLWETANQGVINYIKYIFLVGSFKL